MKVVVSAPGVVKFFGEHAVVYGTGAIAASIDKRLYVTAKLRTNGEVKIAAYDLSTHGVIVTLKPNGEIVVGTDYGKVIPAIAYVRKAIELTREYLGERAGVELEIKSDMPVGAGLGTSAAVSVATVFAYATITGHELEKREIAKLGHRTELTVQGAASPMDTAVATYGGLLYIKPTSSSPIIEPVKKGAELPTVIGYVKRVATTKELVAWVRKLRDRYTKLVDQIIWAIGELVERARVAIEKGELRTVGELMNINHGLLEALGVSDKRLNDMVYAARMAGAIGAKLSGAGGGGCMLALAPNRLKEVATAIAIANGTPIITELGVEGVRVEKVEK